MVCGQRNPISQDSLRVTCGSTPLLPTQLLRHEVSLSLCVQFPIIFPSISLIVWRPDSLMEKRRGVVLSLYGRKRWELLAGMTLLL